VQTDTAIVPNAGARILFSTTLAPRALLTPRATLLDGLAVELQRVRVVREAAG